MTSGGTSFPNTAARPGIFIAAVPAGLFGYRARIEVQAYVIATAMRSATMCLAMDECCIAIAVIVASASYARAIVSAKTLAFGSGL